MRTNEDVLCEVIMRYIEISQQKNELIKYLYNHTELFESKWEEDFNEKLHNFFAKKLGRENREIKELYDNLSEKQIGKITFFRMMK